MRITADDPPRLVCPVCNFDYVHIESAFVLRGTMPLEERVLGTVTGHVRCEDRDCVVLKSHCENGHGFILRLQQHKGYTIVSYDLCGL